MSQPPTNVRLIVPHVGAVSWLCPCTDWAETPDWADAPPDESPVAMGSRSSGGMRPNVRPTHSRRFALRARTPHVVP